jgi:hypothetical protein
VVGSRGRRNFYYFTTDLMDNFDFSALLGDAPPQFPAELLIEKPPSGTPQSEGPALWFILVGGGRGGGGGRVDQNVRWWI